MVILLIYHIFLNKNVIPTALQLNYLIFLNKCLIFI